MNRVAETLLHNILGEAAAWDKKTRQLRYRHVLVRLYADLELEWYGLVYFRMYHRACALWRQSFPGELRAHFFEQISFMGEPDGWSIIAEDDLTCQWVLSEHLEHYCNVYFLQQHPEWAHQDVSEEEILALGIRPKVVPDKPGQSSLF